MTARDLLIISHTPHYKQGGQIVGWGPTVREIDHLAGLFEHVTHLAPLHPDAPPPSAAPYTAPNVRLSAVNPAGGPNLRDKLGILRAAPGYVSAIRGELRRLGARDVVHVRCPANLSLIALLSLSLSRRPRTRWIKYAGNWQPAPGDPDPRSYAVQRWLLRRNGARAVVTINGEWPGQPAHIHSFYNPCLTELELTEAAHFAQAKQLGSVMSVIYAGALDTPKGVGRVVPILAEVRRLGVNATLEVAGDGPQRAAMEAQARALNVAECVAMHGWLPRAALKRLYARAHVALLPSQGEGWPKMLSEAMAFGALPVAGAVSCIPAYVARFGAGRALAPDDVPGFAATLVAYARDPGLWRRESERAAHAAARFTYSHYLNAVQSLLGL